MAELEPKVAAMNHWVLTARLGDALYAIPIECVEEVLPALPIESMPQCPPFVRGVVFVRGQLIPVVSGAERLDIKNHQRPLEPHIVCLRSGDRLVGVEFDEALDLIQLAVAEPLAASELGARESFFVSVVELNGKIVRLLDPQKLIRRDEAARWNTLPSLDEASSDS